ncbi:hypothetical protein [Duganella aceris]|uniref:DUF4375 domain-containing protein n=1 Tax=Duganella aceris TaxID=2703883 RepID=A0ABX0FFE2_9BURK|nr:hypothetical protein [Duganella aceris]NGZ83249.1 hypothetical protein [Duganella aceris]
MAPLEPSEISAFPRDLTDAVRAALSVLMPDQMFKPVGGLSVRVSEESLLIPYRTYYDMARVRRAADAGGRQGLVALCLGARHHDGFLRESCARRLLARDESWVIPFLFQLLGEYVVEIIRPIEEAIAADGGKYAAFVRANPAYFLTTEQRALSYWDAYYRLRYPDKRDYPALKAIAALKAISHPV